MKPKVLAIEGAKKVGKTTTTEKLITELTKRGYKVAALKHVSEPDFTIDTPRKDTWRYAQAGAKTIAIISPNETATIEKGNTENITLETLLKKSSGNDIILIEGLKHLVAKNKKIPKIIVTTNQAQAANALKSYTPILAFSGPYEPKAQRRDIPYADALKNPEKLADIVEKTMHTSKA